MTADAQEDARGRDKIVQGLRANTRATELLASILGQRGATIVRELLEAAALSRGITVKVSRPRTLDWTRVGIRRRLEIRNLGPGDILFALGGRCPARPAKNNWELRSGNDLVVNQIRFLKINLRRIRGSAPALVQVVA